MKFHNIAVYTNKIVPVPVPVPVLKMRKTNHHSMIMDVKQAPSLTIFIQNTLADQLQ